MVKSKPKTMKKKDWKELKRELDEIINTEESVEILDRLMTKIALNDCTVTISVDVQYNEATKSPKVLDNDGSIKSEFLENENSKPSNPFLDAFRKAVYKEIRLNEDSSESAGFENRRIRSHFTLKQLESIELLAYLKSNRISTLVDLKSNLEVFKSK